MNERSSHTSQWLSNFMSDWMLQFSKTIWLIFFSWKKVEETHLIHWIEYKWKKLKVFIVFTWTAAQLDIGTFTFNLPVFPMTEAITSIPSTHQYHINLFTVFAIKFSFQSIWIQFESVDLAFEVSLRSVDVSIFEIWWVEEPTTIHQIKSSVFVETVYKQMPIKIRIKTTK